jgi:hypothetical protein
MTTIATLKTKGERFQKSGEGERKVLDKQITYGKTLERRS